MEHTRTDLTLGSRWIGVWQSAPAGVPTDTQELSQTHYRPFAVQGTVRYRVRVAHGGECIRVRLSNEYSADPLEIGAASVGFAGEGFDALAGSIVPLGFSGSTGVCVPGRAPAISDPVAFQVRSQADLVVSLFLPVPVMQLALDIRRDTIIALRDGDQTCADEIANGECLAARPIVSAVYALTNQPTAVVAVLGDSIVDGDIDPESGNQGWPGFLSEKLAEQPVSVINAGIGGNRLLTSEPLLGSCALARLDISPVCGIMAERFCPRFVLATEAVDTPTSEGACANLGQNIRPEAAKRTVTQTATLDTGDILMTINKLHASESALVKYPG